MKRKELIELGIIAAAIVFCIRLFGNIVSIVVSSIYTLSKDSYSDAGYLFQYFIISLLYLGAIILLIRYKEKIAIYINGKGNNDLMIGMNLHKIDILHIVIITSIVVILIDNLSEIALYVIQYFKTAIKPNHEALDQMSRTTEYIDLKISLV